MKKLLLLSSLLCIASPAFADIATDKVQAFETSEDMKNGAVFLTLSNTGDKGDALVSVSSDIAERTELHEMAQDNGVMKMRKVNEIAIDPGQSVELKPHGYHIMLLKLKKPLKSGDKFPLTLTFENNETKTIEASVTSRQASSQPASPDKHGHAHGHH